MLFPARSNPLCGWEIASSGLDTCTCSRCKCTAKEHAYSTLLATTLPILEKAMQIFPVTPE
jgi:hypothetical protein